MNKYLVSLMWLSVHCNTANKRLFEERNNQVAILEELIDNYLKLEKALDTACNVLDEGYGNKDAEYEYYTSLCDKKDIPKHMSSKQWKEWLLENE